MRPVLPRPRALLVAACTFFCLHVAAAQTRVPGYTAQTLRGFTVYVNDAGVQTYGPGMQAALDELDAQLLAITTLGLGADRLTALRAVKIFLDWAQTTGGAQYHPGRDWLVANGYAPEKERSVEVSNAVNFVAWSRQNQPQIVLHELAHAYHHQVLGYTHAATRAAFANARDSGVLASVLYNPGGGATPYRRPAYALTNETEYFAEITEAYWGQNDFYPFNRADLASYDAQGYALMVAVWGTATSTEADGPSASAFSVFPNPVRDALHVEVSAATDVSVFDLTGRVVAKQRAEPGRAVLDLSGLPSGVYLVRAGSEAGGASRVVVRVQ